MRKHIGSWFVVVFIASLVVAGSAFAAQTQQRMTYTAMLKGANETPKPGSPGATGTGTFTLDSTTYELCYSLKVSGLQLPAAKTHIHRGAAGVAGPVVVPFTSAPDANGNATGCVKATEAVADEIMANPANFYVNVHNAAYPDGAMRGQLSMSSPNNMPNTGASSNLTMLAIVGLLLATVGSVFAVAVRRRTSHTA
ncbi:MAG: hypothetical protein NVSMB42_26630 [Herpetosiphon sp.]